MKRFWRFLSIPLIIDSYSKCGPLVKSLLFGLTIEEPVNSDVQTVQSREPGISSVV